jgi:hypothetical protein
MDLKSVNLALFPFALAGARNIAQSGLVADLLGVLVPLAAIARSFCKLF